MTSYERRFSLDAYHCYTLEEMQKIAPEEVRRYREQMMQSDINTLREYIRSNQDDPKSWDWMFTVAKECLKELEHKEYLDALAGRRDEKPRRNIQCRKINEILIPFSETEKIDNEFQMPINSQTASSEISRNFDHSEDYRSVRINGQIFTLTTMQARIIEILHRQYKGGLPEVGADYVMTEVDSPRSRLRDAFKTNKDAYRALIVAGKKKGVVKLNLD